jgi:hypothetical protein
MRRTVCEWKAREQLAILSDGNWPIAYEKPALFLLTSFAEISFRILGPDRFLFYFSFKKFPIGQDNGYRSKQFLLPRRFRYKAMLRTTRHKPTLLGEFLKLRKATISFVMFVCPSICLHGTTRFPPEEFCWKLISILHTICWENINYIKIWLK